MKTSSWRYLYWTSISNWRWWKNMKRVFKRYFFRRMNKFEYWHTRSNWRFWHIKKFRIRPRQINTTQRKEETWKNGWGWKSSTFEQNLELNLSFIKILRGSRRNLGHTDMENMRIIWLIKNKNFIKFGYMNDETQWSNIIITIYISLINPKNLCNWERLRFHAPDFRLCSFWPWRKYLTWMNICEHQSEALIKRKLEIFKLWIWS
jgi:hypothetical protein